MLFSISIFFPLLLIIVTIPSGIDGLQCRSCEGDMCNYNSRSILCEFGVYSCMRIYSSITGRTYKAGCLYPVENCARTQFISGEQMQCQICNSDNCNNIQPPYQPDSFGPSGQWPPYYPEDGRFRPNDWGRYGGGYHWNGAIGQNSFLFKMFTLLISLLVAFVLQ